MKRNSFISLLILMSSSVVILSSCSSKSSINSEQAIQILNMIARQQYTFETDPNNAKEVEAHQAELSYVHVTEGNDNSSEKYEISNFNKIVHFQNSAEDVPETWYYIDSNLGGALFSKVIEDDGSIKTTLIESDPEEARTKFGGYRESYLNTILTKIKEVDNPSMFVDIINNASKVDKYKLKTKYFSAKNKDADSDLTASIEIYKDREKKNLDCRFNFNYVSNYLVSYSFYEMETGNTDTFNISYEQQLNIENI